ncbi:hypothetical protein HA402_014191 [Bradysia odoriphaga]|nr:hypothetical protein HA402_014191 [Bradysia odoriphaga]
MSNRPIKIDVHNKWAKRIYDQWQQIDTLKSHAAELYKCDRCLGMEITYKWNLGMCPEELCGLLNCHPEHKEGIQAYLATDATPEQGGIAFYTKTGWQKCFYYQPDFSELGIRIDPAKPTEFEMINLLVALFIFKREILNHKTVRIIVDNNFLRTRAKSQRHALTEAIAAILESCDLFGSAAAAAYIQYVSYF